MIELSTKAELDAVCLKHALVVVDFWAPTCGPCMKLLPVLGHLAKLVPGVAFVKVKVNERSNDLCELFNVERIPTLAMLVRGECKDKVIGDDIEAILSSILTQYVAVYDV